MPDKAYRDSVPVILFICAVSMVLAAFFIVIVLLINNRSDLLINRKNGLVNQTYIRAADCKVSVPVELRTDQWISGCYDKAEHTTGVKIERYGGIK